MRITACLIFLLLVLLTACEAPPEKKTETVLKQPQETAVQPQVQRPEVQSLEPQRVELTTGALPLWRQFSSQKPALVLLSFDPFLKPLPTELKARATDLVQQGTPEDFDQHGSYFRVDPVILPNQTLSAAIDAGLFSKIYWVFPAKTAPEALDLARFKEQMVEAGFFSEADAETLSLSNAVFSGELRGLPFQALHYLAQPEVNEPMVLHIDLSYFKGLYNDEIKTPLYSLIHQTASNLKQVGWSPLMTTLSYSTLEGEIALDTRFIISNLAEVLADPSLLAEESMPEAWRLRAESLYAADMFSESKKLELSRKAAELAPEDPNALYDLFQTHFLARELEQALAVLDRTVKLDPGFAAAYLALADMARQDNNLAVSYDLLNKAKPYFRNNPFIDLQRADLLLQKGEKQKALEIIDDLMEQAWSPIYRSEMPKLIDDMHQAALAPPAEGQTDGQ